MMDCGATPFFITKAISPFEAQSKPVPSVARVCITIGLSLHLTATSEKEKREEKRKENVTRAKLMVDVKRKKN